MSRSLKRFWQALEALPDLAAVPSEWRALLGAEHDLVRPLLLPTPRLAGSVKSTAPGRLCVHQIRRFKGEYLAVCPDGCDAVTLSREELVVHKLDVPALCRQIAEALGLEATPPEALPRLPKALNIGAYVPYSGRRFAACLAAVSEPDDLRRAVDVLSADGKPFVLLAPTRGAFNQACADAVKRTRSSFFALAETLGLDDCGRLAMLDGRTAADLFAEFRGVNNLDAAEQPDGEFFPTPPGVRWEDVAILFKDAHTVSVSVGDVQRVLNYTKMGMADRRDGDPNVQWELLHQFALGNGRMTWQKRNPRAKYVGPEDLTDEQAHATSQRRGPGKTFRKQKQLLTASLQKFFKIDGDPFIVLGGGGWRARFTVTGDSAPL